MKKFKFTAKLLAASVAAITLAVCANAAQVTDINGHWSEEYVKYGIENEYINGYPDGTFLPDKPVTRAEFAKMMNSAVGFTETADTKFTDIEEDKWYYPEVCKAVWAEYIVGYEDGSFRAGSLITRQEAAVMLSRIATRVEDSKNVDGFPDSADVASWAKSAFDFAYSKGFFSGDDLGRLNPNATLTRAQAAKLLYGLRNTENVRNMDYTVALDTAICSETVFTDDVYFTADGEGASLVIDGCTIVGTLYIRTNNACTVTIEDSKIKEVYVYSADSTVVLKNGATVKIMNLPVPSKISGNGVKTLVLKGDNIASGTTEITASPDSVEVYSDAVIKADKLSKLVVSNGVSLTVQDGDIAKMVVDKDAKGSVITLSSGVEVEDLDVNAASSFMGKGKIKNAKNSVSGVTYATAPENVTGGKVDDDDNTGGNNNGGNNNNNNDNNNNDNDNNNNNNNNDNTGDTGNTDASKLEPVTVTPANGQTDVDVDVNPYINFGKKLFDNKNNEITAEYIADKIELRKKSSAGDEVDFEVEYKSSGRIVLVPESDLLEYYNYCIVIPAGVFVDAAGNTNAESIITFKTGESGYDENPVVTAKTITFTPANNSNNVNTGGYISINFSEPVKAYDGEYLTNTSIVADDVIEIREGDRYGEEVSVTASINSSRRNITLTPKQNLKAGVKYCIIITSNSLQYDDGTRIYAQYSYFTTKDNIGITATPKYGANAIALDSKIVVDFDCEIFADDGSEIINADLEDIVKLTERYESGTNVDFDAEISKDYKTITITPKVKLTTGLTYYIVIPAGVVTNKNGTANLKFSSYFTAITNMQPAITPADGAKNVTEEKVVIEFDEPVYKDRYGKEAVDADYIKQLINEGSIKLTRQGYTSNLLKDPQNIDISTDGKIITITAKSGIFSPGRTYVVNVVYSKLWNKDGRYSNQAASATFETPASNSVTIKPAKMVDENIAAVDTTIEIRFDKAVKSISGSTLSTYDIQKAVRLSKNSEDGAVVAFSVISINNDGKVITIKPNQKLEGETTYFVVINPETMKDSDGEYNSRYSSSFVTEESVVRTCEITPKNGATKVPVTTDIVIKYESALYRQGGKTGGRVTENYLKSNNVITLVDNSRNTVEFDLILSDDCKVITIKPKEQLKVNTRYTLNVVNKNLYYYDGSNVDSKSVWFETAAEISSIDELVVSDVTDKSAVVTVKALANGKLTLKYVDGSGNETSYINGTLIVLNAGDEQKIELTGLAAKTKYTVTAEFTESSNNKKTTKTKEFQTAQATKEAKLEDITVGYEDLIPGMSNEVTLGAGIKDGKITVGLFKKVSTLKISVDTSLGDSVNNKDTVWFEVDGAKSTDGYLEITLDKTEFELTVKTKGGQSQTIPVIVEFAPV